MTWLSIDGGNEAKTERACYVAGWDHTNHVQCVFQCTLDMARMPRARTIEACPDPFTEQPDHVVVERHQQDGRIAGGGGKVPPGIVIDLAWNTAAVAYTLARGAPVHEYTPAVWIGSTPKAALHQRIWAALSPAEREIVAAFGRATKPGSRWRGEPHSGRLVDVTAALVDNMRRVVVGKDLLHHDWFNVLDAVGVGKFHIGSVGKGAAPIRRAR